MRVWANAIGYQLASLLSLYAAAAGRPWPGVLACLSFVIVQLVFSQSRMGDLLAILCALGVGGLLDGIWLATGLVVYASPGPTFFAPAWILALWMAFAMTFNHALGWLRGRLRWAAALGAMGGPLAYWSAERIFSAVTLPSPPWPALASLAIGWALAVPAIAWAAAARPAAARLHRQGARS